MPSIVYWGSPRQAQLAANETLPAKLDLILEKLNIRERVKDRQVAIKMHLGTNVGYSVIHPVLVRRVVEAVIEGGGKPFVTDLPWCVEGAHTRGYTTETLGCPLYPSTGFNDSMAVSKPFSFRNLEAFEIGTPIVEADFLIDLAHVKGHPISGYGGVIKNLALGCMTGTTRGTMHDVVHQDPSFFKDRCPDEATRVAIRDSCPYGAIVDDHDDPDGLHLHDYKCNQCMRCTEVAPGVFEPQMSNFHAFLEVVNFATQQVMATFEPGNMTFINIANNMTPVCDCFGFTGMPVMRDAGVFGSDDIVAAEQAVLDLTANSPLIEDALPTMIQVVRREGHPWQWIHGQYKDPYYQTEHAEKIGMGSRQYELVDVLPVAMPDFKQDTYVPASA
ncbi:MAG TPA: DUF362 domain-containing protein [Aggregatilinea sp.]|uniref:DUF362 domain-containing protein n=1 Tax=Aggregatilinea sp. TaxID=2806333 RepID=UPI002BF0CE2C|nr:DUF362 domain-containing protein [Aggregatilinea sp.]HML21628.1 DUF362 domain-containing protein [Aggregatilinea sp.]